MQYSFFYKYQLFFSIGAKKLDIYFNELEKSRCEAKDEKNLCVVIFANYKNKNLDNLLSALNTQTYTKEKYQVHVVYQKEENDATASRDFALGARIHNIQNPDYFSKDKAVNLFLQKMIEKKIPKWLGVTIIIFIILALASLVIYLITTVMLGQISSLFSGIIEFIKSLGETNFDINFAGLETSLTDTFR